ncbi:MAG: hypothetical protein H6625_10400 [Bdellovibrionaceae bacterium]|nr:hypothetical protein [Pseudobdellovibrionaceae bacterium]
MKFTFILFFIYIFGSCGVHPIFAEESPAPPTGKKTADKFFIKRQESNEDRKTSATGAPRYLAIQFGFFTDEETYKWGKSNKNDVGKLISGITYRIGEWTDSMDLAIRADFVSYEIDDKNPLKISLMPIVTFPDAKSGFPLYFGAGAGLGVFFKQARDESSLSFDYQILAGARFFNIISSMGLIFEFGLKNQLLLLSDGQHNGVYGTLGAVFTF